MPALTLDEVKRRVGRGLAHVMADVVGTERAAEGVAIFRGVYDRVCEDETELAPGAAAAVSELRRLGIRMSVASNKPAAFSTRILAALGLRPYFDAVEGP